MGHNSNPADQNFWFRKNDFYFLFSQLNFRTLWSKPRCVDYENLIFCDCYLMFIMYVTFDTPIQTSVSTQPTDISVMSWLHVKYNYFEIIWK